jgi:hypothetical protein
MCESLPRCEAVFLVLKVNGMNESADAWVERVRDLPELPSQEEAEALVRKVYESAQKDLDDQRAQAEYEREE